MNSIKCNPRLFAIRAVHMWLKKEAFLEDSLNEIFSEELPSSEEKGAAYELALGTVRKWKTILFYLSSVLESSPPKDALKLACIGVGLYQRLFHNFEKAPYALVHEYVEISKTLFKKKNSKGTLDPFVGFMNAILRKSLSTPFEFHALLENTSLSLEERFSIYHSVSQTFAKKLIKSFGEEQTHAILTALNTKPPLYKRGRYVKEKKSFEIQKITQFQSDILCEQTTDDTPYYIQNKTQAELFERAILILSEQLPKTSPITILDMCSAPGGKAVMCWQALQALGFQVHTMTLNEPNPSRHASLKENIQRFHLLADITSYDGCTFPVSHQDASQPYNLVIVDAPCSNSGVFFKCPEARYRLSDTAIFEHISLQSALLQRAVTLAAPSGFVLYMTCSILEDENERCIARIVKKDPTLTLQESHVILPDLTGYEGGFMALLKKQEEQKDHTF